MYFYWSEWGINNFLLVTQKTGTKAIFVTQLYLWLQILHSENLALSFGYSAQLSIHKFFFMNFHVNNLPVRCPTLPTFSTCLGVTKGFRSPSWNLPLWVQSIVDKWIQRRASLSHWTQMYLPSSLRVKLSHKLFKSVNKREVNVKEEMGKRFGKWMRISHRFQIGAE